MSPILVPQTVFSVFVVLIGALLSCACALAYFRHIRMERPAVGTFNGRDIVFLSVFIIALPMLYLVLPGWALTGFLIVTFLASLSIGYRNLLAPTTLWLTIGLLIGVNIWLAETQLGTVRGWQIYWGLTSVIVLLGVVAVVNLYVQGGMRLKHIAILAFGLAFYDAFFSMVIPLTPQLADAFQGKPLDPSIGMRTALLSSNIGIGDLLVYGLFTVAAFKAYGWIGAKVSFGIVTVFGALLPATAPLVLSIVIRGGINVVTPAQMFFGPAALVAYLWLRRRGQERTMAEYLASSDPGHPVATRPPTRLQPKPTVPTTPTAPGAPTGPVAPPASTAPVTPEQQPSPPSPRRPVPVSRSVTAAGG